MIAETLRRLFEVSKVRQPAVRLVSYAHVADGISEADKVLMIAVLAEGAMHGPDAARGMAAEIGR